VERPHATAPSALTAPEELAQAVARIAALERKIGQWVLELDFFGQARIPKRGGS